MANKKISEFATVASIEDTDLFTTVRPGDPAGTKNKKNLASQVKEYIAAGGSLNFISDWNAATNSPALVSGVGGRGDVYRVDTAGSTDLDGVDDWLPDDWAWFDDTVWRKNAGSTIVLPQKVPFSQIYAGGPQTFTLTPAPSTPASVTGFWNGQEGENGVNFTVIGSTLTWLDTLAIGARISGFYNDVATDSIFASIVINDSSAPGAFVKEALEYNNTKENATVITFADTPYSASIGEVVTCNTAGGDISVVYPEPSLTQGARIRTHKGSPDTNTVTITVLGGEFIGHTSSVTLRSPGEGISVISDGIDNWDIYTERRTSMSVTFLPDHDANLGDHRVQNIAGSGDSNFEFTIPNDFGTLVSLCAVFSPTSGAAGVGKDIDLTSDYFKIGEVFNFHSEADTGTVYDTGTTNVGAEIDLSPVFSNIEPNDICGVNIDQNGIGGTMSYYNIRFIYLTRI